MLFQFIHLIKVHLKSGLPPEPLASVHHVGHDDRLNAITDQDIAVQSTQSTQSAH